jgi:hypothetical protein
VESRRAKGFPAYSLPVPAVDMGLQVCQFALQNQPYLGASKPADV